MNPTLPRAVVDAWLVSRGVHTVSPVGGGLSGAEVFCAVAAADRRWALRRWPRSTDVRRVAEVHRVMVQGRQGGCEWLPELQLPATRRTAADSWVVADGAVWDCCQWIEGRAAERTDDVADVLRQTTAAVAQFHAAVAPLAQQQEVAAAAVARLQRLAELDALLRPLLADTAAVHRATNESPVVGRAVRTLLDVWPVERQRAARLLQPWTQRRVRQQYVFRDIHVGNTLFSDGRLCGIVDYDAVRVDSPATDLARLILSVRLLLPVEHLQRGSERFWRVAFQAYRSVSPLEDDEQRLAMVLAEVSPLVILGNWVVWIVCQRRSFPGPIERVHQRMDDWGRLVRQQYAAGPLA